MPLNQPNPETIDLLLGRRSVKTRDMTAPAPHGEDLETILTAAMRVPDHGKLTPWRYIVLDKHGQEILGESISDALIAESETSEKVADKMAGFATQGPLLIVAVFSPERDHKIPLLEQQFSCGASCMNMLISAHALGYVGLWLTGWASRSRAVARDLGLNDNEEVAGFMFFGTSAREPSERPRPCIADKVTFGLNGV